MKNLILLFVSVFTMSAMAEGGKPAKTFSRPYGMAGCGLGSVMVGKKGSQVFAATTNGSSASQLFGITSGTSNCVDTPKSKVASRVDQFILVNRFQVQGDIAKGSGETLQVLATTFGCDSSLEKELSKTLKQNYGQIFSSKNKTTEITDSIITIIEQNDQLSNSCKQLS